MCVLGKPQITKMVEKMTVRRKSLWKYPLSTVKHFANNGIVVGTHKTAPKKSDVESTEVITVAFSVFRQAYLSAFLYCVRCLEQFRAFASSGFTLPMWLAF